VDNVGKIHELLFDTVEGIRTWKEGTTDSAGCKVGCGTDGRYVVIRSSPSSALHKFCLQDGYTQKA